MNPDRANNTFLTSSHDATVLVWDQRSDAAVVRPTDRLPSSSRHDQEKADGGLGGLFTGTAESYGRSIDCRVGFNGTNLGCGFASDELYHALLVGIFRCGKSAWSSQRTVQNVNQDLGFLVERDRSNISNWTTQSWTRRPPHPVCPESPRSGSPTMGNTWSSGPLRRFIMYWMLSTWLYWLG